MRNTLFGNEDLPLMRGSLARRSKILQKLRVFLRKCRVRVIPSSDSAEKVERGDISALFQSPASHFPGVFPVDIRVFGGLCVRRSLRRDPFRLPNHRYHLLLAQLLYRNRGSERRGNFDRDGVCRRAFPPKRSIGRLLHGYGEHIVVVPDHCFIHHHRQGKERHERLPSHSGSLPDPAPRLFVAGFRYDYCHLLYGGAFLFENGDALYGLSQRIWIV